MPVHAVLLLSLLLLRLRLLLEVQVPVLRLQRRRSWPLCRGYAHNLGVVVVVVHDRLGRVCHVVCRRLRLKLA